MKVWELKENTVYTSDNKEFFECKKGVLYVRKPLKSNGCMSWCICDLTYNTLKTMDFIPTGEFYTNY